MRAGFTVFCAALAAAQPAAGQSSHADQIVVQGVRQSDRQIGAFVKALTNTRAFGQIGRFHAATCPTTVGLLPQQNAAVTARMRAVAGAANISVGAEGCTPNAFVILARNRRAAIHDLYHLYPVYFTGMGSKQINQLAERSEPASAWQVVTRISSDGQILKKAAGADYYVNETGEAPSRIKAASVPAFVASIVVIDLNAAAGLTLTQLADYAAMRTFADTSPSRAAGVSAPSILTILDKAPDQMVPVSLTSWDLAFLKSLYATSNAYYAGYQQGDMAKVVKDELTGAKPHR